MGVGVTPGIPKPNVVLTDFNGESFSIQPETEGFVTMLFVGYTNCPDVCPTHLSMLARALDELPADVTDRVKVLFITSDPERDTTDVLKSYLAQFDESFIGLTGDQTLIEGLQAAVGQVPATRDDLGDGDYAMEHSAFVIAFGADNQAHLVYPFGIPQEAWSNDLTKLARQGWEGS